MEEALERDMKGIDDMRLQFGKQSATLFNRMAGRRREIARCNQSFIRSGRAVLAISTGNGL